MLGAQADGPAKPICRKVARGSCALIDRSRLAADRGCDELEQGQPAHAARPAKRRDLLAVNRDGQFGDAHVGTFPDNHSAGNCGHALPGSGTQAASLRQAPVRRSAWVGMALGKVWQAAVAGPEPPPAIALVFEGQRQYVQLTADALLGVAASDGKFLWRYDRPANRMAINCSTPVFQDGLVFASSAYGNGGGAVKLSKDASGAVKAEEVYFTTRMQNHHGGMIVVDGCLYGASGGNEGGFLACLDFQSGDLLWRDREAPKGSLALADGRLYLRTEEGAMLLIEPNRERLVARGRFDQPDRSRSPAWTHPVVANGKLYVRDQDLLFCYDIKPK